MSRVAPKSPDRVIDLILSIPRPIKRLIAMSMDAAMCLLSVWLAFYLRLGYWPHPADDPAKPMLASIAIALPIFVSFGLYRAIFRYAGWHALITVAKAVALYGVVFAVLYTMVGISGTPRTVGIIQPLLLLVLIGSSRTAARLLFEETYTALWRDTEPTPVLIYGAGNAGRELAGAIALARDMRLVGFVDDDRRLWGSELNGVRIYAPTDLRSIIRKRMIKEIMLAVPSTSGSRRREIASQLMSLGLHVRTLPSMNDIARGKITVGDLKELDITDLLGRPAVPPDRALLDKTIGKRVVLVTGAGGSIGGELCRQIRSIGPAKLVLVDHSEYNLYRIHQELSGLTASGDGVELVPLLASVCDEAHMTQILAFFRPDAVFHAAAYKHVPLVEHNLAQGVHNNTFGTLITAQIAQRFNVSDFVLISTDKAVRPTNAMGASKRAAELVIQALDRQGGETRFSMVRFGNVLGSSGSVVPLFRRQVKAGGPVTLTDPEITRYFMTIPEAAQLVLQAGAMAIGGDVFVLDMGEPVKIRDLARNVIELSGCTVKDAENPDGDIEIRVEGLRPGEKLHEELLIGGVIEQTAHPRIMRSQERFMPWAELAKQLDALGLDIASGDPARVREGLRLIVPEYVPNSPIADYLSKESSIADPQATKLPKLNVLQG